MTPRLPKAPGAAPLANGSRPRKCRHCGWATAAQVFECGEHIYRISGALAVLKDAPRKPITLPSGHMYEQLVKAHISRGHLGHVNIRYPVIAIPYEDSFCVIDGNHRALGPAVSPSPPSGPTCSRSKRRKRFAGRRGLSNQRKKGTR